MIDVLLLYGMLPFAVVFGLQHICCYKVKVRPLRYGGLCIPIGLGLYAVYRFVVLNPWEGLGFGFVGAFLWLAACICSMSGYCVAWIIYIMKGWKG